jgi:chromosome segregation ATPase
LVPEAEPLQQSSSNIAILQELSEVLSGISSLEASASRNATAITALQTTVRTLTTQVTAVQASLNSIQANVQELISMSETVSTELATDTTDINAAVTAMNAAVGALSSLGSQLQQAIANAGLTPDQAASFDGLHTSLEQVTASLNSAVSTATTPTPAAQAAHVPPHKA